MCVRVVVAFHFIFLMSTPWVFAVPSDEVLVFVPWAWLPLGWVCLFVTLSRVGYGVGSRRGGALKGHFRDCMFVREDILQYV